MVQQVRLQRLALTLRRRRDVFFVGRDDEDRAKTSASAFLADKFRWSNDRQFMAQLRELLGLPDMEAGDLRWKIERAIETGELVTIPDWPAKTTTFRQNGSGSAYAAPVSPASGFAVTPSQAFGRVTRTLVGARSFEPPPWSRLPANDFFAIMAANPGDVLPDGRIAKALNAAPFEYVPHALSEEAMDLAAKTNNPDYAAKMLGYDRDTFGAMLHVFKPQNGLRPNDNVIFYDDGSVEFQKQILDDNIHNYAP